MSTRRGRPCKAGVTRSKRIVVRVTPDEHREITRLAQLNQSTVGEWLRFACLAAAGDSGEPLAIVMGGTLQSFAIIRR